MGTEEFYLLEDGKLDEWIEAHGFGGLEKPVRTVLIDVSRGEAFFEVWVIDEQGQKVTDFQGRPQTFQVGVPLRSLP